MECGSGDGHLPHPRKRRTVPSGTGDLTYRQGSGTESAPGRFSDLYDTLGIRPPEIPESSLPALRSGASSLKGGTWVVWNGKMLHYPVAYDGSASSFSGGTATSPPTLGGKPPTSEPLPAGMSLDPATQQLVVGDADVLVSPYNGALNSLSLVTSPAANQPGGANPAAVQLVFQPSSGQQTPQLRTAGPITVAGNVLGRGSLIATGTDSGITIQGKAQIDPGSDSGVALYASGDVSIMPLDRDQLPVALGGNPAKAPPGNPVYQALAQALQFGPVGSDEGANPHSFNRYLAGDQVVIELDPLDANDPSTGTIIQNVGVHVTAPDGSTMDGLLADVLGRLRAIEGQPDDNDGRPFVGEPTRMSVSEINALLAEFVGSSQTEPRTANGFSAAQRVTTADAAFSIPARTFAAWYSYGAPTQPEARPEPPTVTLPEGASIYDQEFGGLVYARKGFHIPDAENFRLNGSMVTYQGGVDIRAKSLDFQYSPGRIGNFAGFFGGRVMLAPRFSASL